MLTERHTPSRLLPQAYSIWIYDRHCTLIYHHDWSLSSSSAPALLSPGPDLLPGVSRCVTHPQAKGIGQGRPSNAAPNAPSTSNPSGSSSSKLPLTEHAKLIYGLVFSLRNMLSKLSPPSSSGSSFNTYTTPTYTLAHYQTASLYTFVLLTDPVQPPSRALPLSRSSLSSFSGATPSSPSVTSGGASDGSGSGGGSSLSGGGGGIPATGGMSLPGVLRQLVAGPWVEWVVKNPAMSSSSSGAAGLEWEEMEDVQLDDDESGTGQAEGTTDLDHLGVKSEVHRGVRSRGVDSDGLRHSIESGEFRVCRVGYG